MSEEELVNGVYLLKKRFYSFNNFSRTVQRREHMNPLLLVNMMGTHLFSKMQFRYSDL